MIQWNDFTHWITNRLQQPLPGYEAQKKMMNVNRPDFKHAPRHARESGVLILLYPQDNDVKTVLIERSADGGIHSGQVALPGGKKEDTDIDIIQTALREANEEIELKQEDVTVIGRLSPLYIPVSNFEVNPIVGVCPYEPLLIPSEKEVAAILSFPLRHIFSRKEIIEVKASGLPSLTIRTQAYLLNEHQYIWGATAMILSELESLWEEWLCFKY